MIYSIIILAQNQMAAVNITLLSIYIAIVALTQLPLVVVCLLLAVSPLICLGLVFFCCCCSEQSSAAQYMDVPSKEASAQDIVNAGGDCSICFMSITVGAKIFILPCSEKHVFHCDCLRHWAKVKNSCPICRREIPMTNAERESQSQNN